VWDQTIPQPNMPKPLPISDGELRSLIGSFTHDLRNPLSAIVSNLDFATRVAVQQSMDPDFTESLTDSVTACDVLRRILANLDVLAAKDRAPGLDQEVAVPELVTDIVERCQAQAEQAGLSIVVTGVEGAARARLDGPSFALAIENLIADSLTHAPGGSKVTVTLEQSEQEILVHVCDRGPAIPAELRDLAVSAEGQTGPGRKTGSRYARGATLLAARAAAKACGGALRLSSDGDGSRLTVAVPLAS
jgi:signal transduction histidine kinase